jgi:hypothetical protein
MLYIKVHNVKKFTKNGFSRLVRGYQIHKQFDFQINVATFPEHKNASDYYVA